MQPAARRVKTIYSVIASSNRLDILRILNAKGPLSYSELKTLAGFKSKKESGKFAYHLRKLVRQMLVSLNRSERKYTVTNLGRLVLNLTRQIEEQSVIESGKLFVRTSHHSMEEFDVDKITQSLVREAGMPVELAQKITSEAEARLYKFQTTYLTAPLIREMVNALLIEHGYEEYRHKLTRLGLPIYDVSELMIKVGGSLEGIESIMTRTAQSVFSEYVLLAQLPKDVADAHLAGDIHLSNVGSWGLIPDTLFVSLTSLEDCGVNLGGKVPVIPRVGTPINLGDAISAFITLTSLLSREASVEITYEGFSQLLSKFSKGKTVDELKNAILRGFTFATLISTQGFSRPKISIQVGGEVNTAEGVDESLIQVVEEATIKAYNEHVLTTPAPTFRLLFNLTSKECSTETITSVASVVQNGGYAAISTNKRDTRSFAGLRKSLKPAILKNGGIAVLHSLSLNLPRLARESNRDDTYFRAKLALLIQLSLNALVARKKTIHNAIKNGLLPTLTHNRGLVSAESTPLIINLTGLTEASSNLVGERAAPTERRSIAEKILETATKVMVEKAEKMGEQAGVCIMHDEGARRFAALDIEKYGRFITITDEGSPSYSQTPLIEAEELSNEDTVQELNQFNHQLNGGYSVSINIPKTLTLDETSNIMSSALNSLEFFKFRREVMVCRNCGAKVTSPSGRCKVCKSASLVSYLTF